MECHRTSSDLWESDLPSGWLGVTILDGKKLFIPALNRAGLHQWHAFSRGFLQS